MQPLPAQSRAAVVAYLTARFEVDRVRLQAVGIGDGAFLVPARLGVLEPRRRI